ncbi:uncharacterized protein BDW70DRAFT_142145 [Aspergillus foveolatus]|uniref:uncharacterized protein n=1 Tax=Aspergillus foveolatus TaxID=210207 RepID=UPI003CCE1F05
MPFLPRKPLDIYPSLSRPALLFSRPVIGRLTDDLSPTMPTVDPNVNTVAWIAPLEIEIKVQAVRQCSTSTSSILSLLLSARMEPFNMESWD